MLSDKDKQKTMIRIKIRIEVNNYYTQSEENKKVSNLVKDENSLTCSEEQSHGDIPVFNKAKPKLGISVSDNILKKVYDVLIKEQWIKDMDYASFRFYFDIDIEPPVHLNPIMWMYGRKDAFTWLLTVLYKHNYTYRGVTFEECKRRAIYILLDRKGENVSKLPNPGADLSTNHERFVNLIVSCLDR